MRAWSQCTIHSYSSCATMAGTGISIFDSFIAGSFIDTFVSGEVASSLGSQSTWIARPSCWSPLCVGQRLAPPKTCQKARWCHMAIALACVSTSRTTHANATCTRRYGRLKSWIRILP